MNFRWKMRKMKLWILKSRNDISRELTMTVSWSLFLKKIQTFSCGKIKSSLEALSNLTGTDSISEIFDSKIAESNSLKRI